MFIIKKVLNEVISIVDSQIKLQALRKIINQSVQITSNNLKLLAITRIKNDWLIDTPSFTILRNTSNLLLNDCIEKNH